MNDLFDPAGESVASATLYEPHPLAALFPPLPESEYAALRDDIAANGVRAPVVIWKDPDGKPWLLDGVHRQRAARETGRELPYMVTVSDDPDLQVIAANILRRHLFPSQRLALKVEAARYRIDIHAQGKRTDLELDTTLLDAMSGDGDGDDDFVENSTKLKPKSELAKEMDVKRSDFHNAFMLRYEASPELWGAVLGGSVKNIPDTRKSIKGKSHEEQNRMLEKVKSEEAEHMKHAARILEKEARREEYAAKGRKVKKSDQWKVECAAIDDFRPGPVDYIITDPPYPKAELECWDMLADFAARSLKPGGLLLAMSGQSFLPEVLRRMEHPDLRWEWMMSWNLAGWFKKTPRIARSWKAMWKPVLVYAREGGGSAPTKAVTLASVDVPKDKEDRSLHDWGQSVSGMELLLREVIPPEERTRATLIADPFLGSGTTGVAALKLGVSFRGADIDEECVKISRSRLSEATE